MMILDDVAMVAGDTARTRAYVQALVQNELVPHFVLIMKNPPPQMLPGQLTEDKSKKGADRGKDNYTAMGNFSFDASEPLEDSLRKAGIPFSSIESADINSDAVIEAITVRFERVFIYSGFGGAILRRKVLDTGKKFIHIHGGYLPDYKGSTTNYYSLIDENECGASSIFLEREIDCGPVLLRRKFPPPEDRTKMDYIYDSAIRASVLIETVRQYAEEGTWRFEMPENKGGETYFIIHPLLKHIAILSRS